MGILGHNEEFPNITQQTELAVSAPTSVILIACFVISTTLNPVIIKVKWRTVLTKTSDFFILLTVTCDLLTNFYFPIIMFVSIIQTSPDSSYKREISVYNIINTVLSDNLTALSITFLALLSIFRFIAIRKPLFHMPKCVVYIATVLAFIVIISVNFFFILHDLLLKDSWFSVYTQRVETLMSNENVPNFRQHLSDVSFAYNIQALCILLRQKLTKQTIRRNRKSAKIIAIMNIGVVVNFILCVYLYYGNKEGSFYESYWLAVTEFFIIAVFPCVLAGYNSLVLLWYDRSVFDTVKSIYRIEHTNKSDNNERTLQTSAI